ncbi:MAG: SBBP repeat-containing protein [Bacteroidota bacterium]|nr:SBBP repeat-containing protein [Bacteroidota bacterium]
MLPAITAAPIAVTPLYGYIENKGQITDQNNNINLAVRYLFNSNGLNIQLRDNGFSYDTYTVERKTKTIAKKEAGQPEKPKFMDEELTMRFHRVDIAFIGANMNPKQVAENSSGYYFNYYTSGTPEAGILNVRSFDKVTYKDLYNGIDLEFSLDQDKKPKYNFIVHAGADATQIKWKYNGALSTILKENKIILGLQQGNLEEHIPASYLLDNYLPVKISYIVDEKNVFGFNVSKYNFSQTLIIDPAPWATYFGGSQQDEAFGIATDSSGNIFITGYTQSTSAISTSGAHQTTHGGGSYDVFVAKYNASGGLQWASYYGGSSNEIGRAIATDVNGNVYITGYTQSTLAISTVGAHQNGYAGGISDAFVVKFNAAGIRQWGTYYGGSGVDEGDGITADTSGNVFISGYTQSSSAISSSGAHQSTFGGGNDAFVVKFDASSARQWGTYYGGSGNDGGYGIAVDANGNVCTTGWTNSTSGISTSGAHQSALGGGTNGDAFIVQFNSSGVRQWGTYCGGSGDDRGYGIVTDAGGNVCITGATYSASAISSFGAHQTTIGGWNDAFVVKFNTSGVRQWGTYYGGSGGESAYGIATDASGNLCITGYTSSSSAISTSGAYQTVYSGVQDVFLVKFDSIGIRQWGSYFGGSGNDWGTGVATSINGDICITGYTASSSLISTSGAQQTSFGGAIDAYLAVFTNMGSLPVQLISFDIKTVKENDDDIVLCSWLTASEINNNYFSIERSKDAGHFESIGFIKGSGNSNKTITYHFTDETPLPGISYYRLKQIDFDNKFEYSKIERIDLGKTNPDITVYPNPAKDQIYIESGNISNIVGYHVKIFNLMGQQVFDKPITQQPFKIDISSWIGKGLYFVQIVNPQGDIIKVRKIILE